MNMYADEVMDHYRHPRNKGPLPDASISLGDTNPFCGDELNVYVKLDGDRITKFSFEGQGCVVSQAAASMLSGRVVGMTREAVLRLTQDDIVDLLGIPVSGMRMKCAMLALRTLQKAFRGVKDVQHP